MLRSMRDGNITEESNKIGAFVKYSGTWVRQWTLMFIHNHGVFCNVYYKKRDLVSLVHDTAAQEAMKNWMLHASTGNSPVTAADFAVFVKAQFDRNISVRTAQVWLKILGFRF